MSSQASRCSGFSRDRSGGRGSGPGRRCARRSARLTPSHHSAVLALAAILLPCLAHAGVEVEVTVGFGGHAKIGRWTPVRVIVNNKGAAKRGELVIPPQPATDPVSDYRVSVDVPPQSRRAFTMYARYRMAAGDLEVEFRPRGRAPIVVKGSCTPHAPESRIVLVVSRKAGGLGTIGTVPIRRNVESEASYGSVESVVAYVTPDRATGALGLPDRAAGYGGVSAVVLRDISPDDFEPSERDALTRWVEAGGLLVVMSAPNAAELRDSFIEELSPVRIRGQRVLTHLGALGQYFRADVNYGRALIADVEVKPEGETIVAQRGLPLLTRRRYESGTVYFCAADCAAPPLRSADPLLREMWSDILEDEHLASKWSPLARLEPVDTADVRGGLADGIVRLPVIEWEAFALLGGYLLAYIAVLVAASLLLKRVDRREWTGHAMVISIAVFSLGAVYVGRSAKLASCRTYEAAVAAAHSGSSVAWLEGITGIRSPAARRFNVTARGEEQTVEYRHGARRARAWPVHQHAGFGLRSVPIDLWGFGSARVQGPWRMDGRITTRLVAIDRDNVAVAVDNETPYELLCPFVLLPGSLGTIAEPIPAQSTRESGPIDRDRLQALASGQPPNVYQELLEHCGASDSGAGDSPKQRMRHRLLRQLGSEEEADQYYGGWGGPTPAVGVTSERSPFAPERPLFGAWIELPAPLVDVSPARGPHVSQVLLLVDIPLDITLPAAGAHRFSKLLPTMDSTSHGIGPADEGRITVSSGIHVLQFRLPARLGGQKANSLIVTTGCDAPGLSAEVYNYQTQQWEKLNVQVNLRVDTGLHPPNDYVRWPQGSVRVRVAFERADDTHVYCALSGELGGS